MSIDRNGSIHQPTGVNGAGQFDGRLRGPSGVKLNTDVPVPVVPGGWKAQSLRMALDQGDRDTVEWLDANAEVRDNTFRLLHAAAESGSSDPAAAHRLAAANLGWNEKMVAREELRPGDIVIAQRDKNWEHGRTIRPTSSEVYVVRSQKGVPASRSHMREFAVMTSYTTTCDESLRPNEVGWGQAYDPEVSSGCSLYRVDPS